MKFLIVTSIFPPDSGGPATYADKLARELIKLNYQVCVVCYSSQDSSYYNNYPYNVITVSYYYAFPLRLVLFFWEVLKRSRDYDFIYSQEAVSEGFPCALACFLTRRNFFVKIVGDFSWEYSCNNNWTTDGIENFQRRKSYPWLIKLIRIIQRFVCQRSVKIIVPSFFLKTIVRQWGIGEEKIKVVYNSYLLSEFKENKSQLKLKLGVSDQCIVSVGRLVAWKGFIELIELIPDLIKRNNKLKLIILGDGPLQSVLEDLINSLNLNSAVILKGLVNRDAVKEHLAIADVFVLNTSYEGFSHVILEAMAAGAPVVTTDAGGNPEIIHDNENGIVVSVGNKKILGESIALLLDDKKLASRLRDRAYIDLQNYSWKKNFSQLLTHLMMR